MKIYKVCAGACLLLLASFHDNAALGQDLLSLMQLEPTFGVNAGALSRYHSNLTRTAVPGMEPGFAPRIGEVNLELPDCQLPAEFEHQGALLFACNDLLVISPDLLVEIARHVVDRIKLVLLVSSVQDYDSVKDLLNAHSIPVDRIRFFQLSHDTMWARDYGPSIVRSKDGRSIVIDAVYDRGRPNDDLVPVAFAHLLALPIVQIPLRLDGGNLLSNGKGLALTTHRLFEENPQVDEESVITMLQATYGLKKVVTLEPLIDEPTGHVDMFATFTSPNTVVVGEYDPAIDAGNAAVLDRNARKLARIRTATGPLRVVRIPMPTREDTHWRTYTNVIFANGVLLVPTYDGKNEIARRKALATYAELLPGWKVAGVNASQIIKSEGALHCLSMNLGPLAEVPGFAHLGKGSHRGWTPKPIFPVVRRHLNGEPDPGDWAPKITPVLPPRAPSTVMPQIGTNKNE